MPADVAGSRRTTTRVTVGAISLSSSSHFPLRLYSNSMKPVTLPPGCARLSTKSAPTGSGVIANTTGMVRGQPQQRCQAHDPRSQNELWRERDEFRRPFARIVGIGGAVSNIQPHVAALDPAQLLQPLPKGRAALVCLGIVSRLVHKHADPSHALPLLRPRRVR